VEAEKEVLEGSGEVPFGIGSRLFFIGTLIILALLTLALFFPFLNVILAVVVLVVILKPLYGYILARNWIRGRQRLAATLTLIAIVVLGIIPVALLLYLTLTQLIELLQNFAELDLESFLSDLSASISNSPLLENLELNPSDIGALVQNLALAAAEWLTNLTLDFVTSLPVLFMQVIVFLILFLTLLPEFDSLVERI
jgi:predicted PurR-regulated permease PerM